MENVLVKMADCGSANIGTCTSSLFIMKHNCLENFSHGVYSDVKELNDPSALEKKKYFSSSDESDAIEDSVSNTGSSSNLNESSDSAICSLDSGLEESDSSESSDRFSFGFGFPSLGVKSEYAFPDLANVFKNPILQSADYDCDDFDSENAGCDDDCFVDSTCSSESFVESDLFWRADSKTTPDQKNIIINNIDSCSNDNNSINDNCSSSPGSSESSNSSHDTGLTVECLKPPATISSLQSTSKCLVDSISAYRENIRFPSDKKPSYLSERLCRWSDCVDHVSSTSKLIEHLQTKHVNPQTFSETFICLWTGCKVFGKPSCSRTWLERHVLSHGGNKPYKCIVDNCGQRFSSQSMLERHINQHFKTPKDYTDGVTETAPKLIRRNGQKLRYRRQPYSVRSRTDVFDAGTMSQLQYLLVQMTQRSKSVSLNVLDSKHFLHVTFQPKVIGCRQETNGNVKYLIRWYPYNAKLLGPIPSNDGYLWQYSYSEVYPAFLFRTMHCAPLPYFLSLLVGKYAAITFQWCGSLEDEWLPKSEIENTRNVPIWKLPASVQPLFWDSIFPNQRSNVRQSRKYKADSSDSR